MNAMMEFDPYVLGTWMSNGYTLAVYHSAPGEEAPRRDSPMFRMMRSVAGASIVAVGMAVSSIPFTAQVAAVSNVVIKHRSSDTSVEAGEVPEGHWAAMAALQRRLPTVPEDTDADLPPLG